MDVTGEKCIRDDRGVMSLDDEAKKVAWKQHYMYHRLLNMEFPWNSELLTPVEPVHGAPFIVTEKMVQDAIKKMKIRKAAGLSIVAEMLKTAGAVVQLCSPTS